MSVVPAQVLPDAARSVPEAGPVVVAELAPAARLWPSLVAVYRAQLSRARVARIPLLFVATFQSIGITVMMRGVVDNGFEARSVVAGSAVLVVAFVALNLLAQYFGQLRAAAASTTTPRCRCRRPRWCWARRPRTPPSRCPGRW